MPSLLVAPEALRFEVITADRVPLLCCLLAFIVTFLVTRLIVRYIRAHAGSTAPRKWWQPHNISLGATDAPADGGTAGPPVHLHHAVIGVVLVLASGISMITFAGSGGLGAFTAAAIVFGIGAALVLDEFALILHLQDVYWSEDGRTSVDAVFVAVAVAGLLVLGFNPLAFFDIDVWRADAAWQSRVLVLVGAASILLLAILVLAKGKVWTGLVGMGFPPLLVVGALRLARPHSPWARWRYVDDPHAMARALARERRIQRPLVRANLWLQSVLAGMPRFPDEGTVDAQLDRQVHAAPARRTGTVDAQLDRQVHAAPARRTGSGNTDRPG